MSVSNQPTVEGSAPQSPKPSLPKLAVFYVIAFDATIVGIGVVLLLNIFTPLEFVSQRFENWMNRDQAELIYFVVRNLSGFLVICLFPLAAMHLLIKPVRRYLAKVRAGENVDTELESQAKCRVINLPFLFTPVSLVMWVLIPGSFIVPVHLLYDLDIHTSVFLFSRASMVGLIASTISFFFIERYERRALIPYFFPQGRLSGIAKAAQLGISRRILLLYLGGTLVPMIILLSTLFILQVETSFKAADAYQYGRGILIFTIVLCGYAFFSALRLNKLVSSSVAQPLREMLRAVDGVKRGDYSGQIQVVSNDEIGELGDAFNEMIHGLADRERLRKVFGKYVTPEVRDEILSGRIPLEGERREATMMFTDLRAFTPFVENNQPEVVIAGMRAYFTAMHQVIRQHRGVVLQFVGDEIEAAFGVPVPFADHADQAMQAALAMRAALMELNRERAAQGLTTFAHGVGLHSGPVLAGNSGSEEQSAYALIGDTVNVASRIQDMSKELKWDILASQETVSRLSLNCSAEEIGPREVKGYSKPVVIYKVVG
jgi:adenylate cyclase